MQTKNILSLNVLDTTYNEFLSEINLETKQTIFSINPEIYLMNRDSKHMYEIMKTATYLNPDGIGVIITSRILKQPLTSRIAGIDLMEKLIQKFHQEPIGFYGAKPNIASIAAKNLNNKYNANIILTIDGYQKDQDEIIKNINESKVKILFVGLGAPRQEQFIYDNIDKLEHVKIIQTVGGSFDIFSNTLKRAPLWMQKMGLEWLYRLIQQPSRFFRQLKLVQFILLVILYKLKIIKWQKH